MGESTPSSEFTDAPVPRLALSWHKPAEELGARRGQLLSSINRLCDAEDELETAMHVPDLRAKLHRMGIAIEIYLFRVYQLREQSIRFFAVASGDPSSAKELRDPEKRAVTFRRLAPLAPVLVERMEDLFKLLDKDVALRNMHTHEQLIGIRLWIEDESYDLEDALTDVEHDPNRSDALAKILEDEMQRLRCEYSTKIRQVADAALQVAYAVDPHSRVRS
jgi:hypothetical protein